MKVFLSDSNLIIYCAYYFCLDAVLKCCVVSAQVSFCALEEILVIPTQPYFSKWHACEFVGSCFILTSKLICHIVCVCFVLKIISSLLLLFIYSFSHLLACFKHD